MEYIRKILIGICVVAIIFSGFQLYRLWSEYHKGQKEYEGLQDYINVDDKDPDQKQDDKGGIQVDFSELKKINSQVIAWLYGKDTKINYPVVQAKDNEYYLKHTFEKQINSSGCLFVDCKNAADFTDDNTIIYGHHMKNGTMFAGLAKYKEQTYYDDHKTMLLKTPEKEYKVNIFAGYVTDEDDDVWTLAFGTEAKKEKWLAKRKKKSCFTSAVTPKIDDTILTMSTCSYEYENARFVLLGVLEEE